MQEGKRKIKRKTCSQVISGFPARIGVQLKRQSKAKNLIKETLLCWTMQWIFNSKKLFFSFFTLRSKYNKSAYLIKAIDYYLALLNSPETRCKILEKLLTKRLLSCVLN